jgi:peptidoglycan/LPS O-acetylase OafA/YrhL
MLNYRREIDGLRALAVIPIIFFHAGFDLFAGGFVGVDVFFVISGYLITSVIITQKKAGTFSLLNFYERRARRILPALFVIMAICIPFALLWFLPNDIKNFAQSLIAVSIFISNIFFWIRSGYFEMDAELNPLLHTWSLAVEEQFYVLFPLFFLIMWRLAKRWTVITLIVLATLSFALAQWGSFNKPAATFFLLPTRAWEIAVGALIAFYSIQRPKQQIRRYAKEREREREREIGGLLGLLLIFYAIFTYNKETPFPSFYALFPVFGTALIIICATPTTIVGRILSTKIFVGIGLISYSAYLWHQPIFSFARYRSGSEPQVIYFIFLIFGSLLLAYLTWKYIEMPFRDKKRIITSRFFFYSVCVSFLFFGIGLTGHFFSDKLKNYWLLKFESSERIFYSQLVSTETIIDDYGADASGSQRLSDCRFNVRKLETNTLNEIKSCEKKYGAGVLILGDSHAIDLFGVVSSRFDNPFLVGITSGGCRPHTPKAGCQYHDVKNFLEQNVGMFKHIIYEQAGFYLLLDKGNKKGNRSMFSNLALNDSIEWIAFDDEHIVSTLEYLNKLSKTVPITWFLPRIEPHISKRFIIKHGCKYNYQIRSGLREKFSKLEKKISSYVTEYKFTGIKLVSQNEFFNFDFPSDFLNCSGLYWSDSDHYSTLGELRFGMRLPENFLKF